MWRERVERSGAEAGAERARVRVGQEWTIEQIDASAAGEEWSSEEKIEIGWREHASQTSQKHHPAIQRQNYIKIAEVNRHSSFQHFMYDIG